MSAAYDRFQRWRRLQHMRFPSLFLPSLPSPAGEPTSNTSIRVHAGANDSVQLIIDGSAAMLCDGCGSLMILPAPTVLNAELDDSASTQSPRPPGSSPLSPHAATCPHCGFDNPLRTARRLLSAEELAPRAAFALLTEAVGAAHVPDCVDSDDVSMLPERFRAWAADSRCRTSALHALFLAIGLYDHQQMPASVQNSHGCRNAGRIAKVKRQPARVPAKKLYKSLYAAEADRFIRSGSFHELKKDQAVALPLSIANILYDYKPATVHQVEKPLHELVQSSSSSSVPSSSSAASPGGEFTALSSSLVSKACQLLQSFDFEAESFDIHNTQFNDGKNDDRHDDPPNPTSVYAQVAKLTAEFTMLRSKARYFNHNIRSFEE